MANDAQLSTSADCTLARWCGRNRGMLEAGRSPSGRALATGVSRWVTGNLLSGDSEETNGCRATFNR